MQLVAPNGSPIIGTEERVYGTALIQAEDATIDDGTINFEYAGETRIDWDSQEPVLEDDRRRYVAADYTTWTEQEVISASLAKAEGE